MKRRLWRLVKLAGYPLFYLFCLLLFGYLTFPFDRLKHRVIAEFDRAQKRSLRKRPSDKPMRLEIGELDGYWFTGIELDDVRLIIPPKRKTGRLAALTKDPDGKPAKDSVISISNATARLQLLPLLLGDVRIALDAKALGGEISGVVPYGDSGDVDIVIEGVQLGKLEPLRAMLQGVPLIGVANGKVNFTPKDGKFAKANGTISLRVDDMVLGERGKDGKLKIQQAELPSAQLGQLTLEAAAKDGVLTLEDVSSRGRDFEMTGDGKIKLHESWARAQADVHLKFRFTDAYRSRNDATEGLLGKPGAKFPPAIEVAPGSPFRAAKTEDGHYRFSLSGPLGRLDPKPAGTNAPKKRSARGSGRASKKTPRRSALMPPRPRPRSKASEDQDEGKEKEEKEEKERKEAEEGGR